MPAQDATATIASDEQATESRVSERHMLIDGQLVGAQHTLSIDQPGQW